MPLDEHHTHNVLLIAGDEHCVLPDKHANLRFIGDLTESHGLEDDRTPLVVPHPRGLHTRRSLFRREVEDRHDSVVSKYAFNSAESCHMRLFLPLQMGYVLDTPHRVKCAYDAMVRLFDTHLHLQDPRFGTSAIRSEALRRARFANVEAALIPAVNPQEWDALNMHISECEEKDLGVQLYFGLGVHPFAVPRLDPSADAGLFQDLERRLAGRSAAVRAVGECGLDYTLKVDRERQKVVLISQIQLAATFKLPLILHCVRAHDDLLDLLARHGAPPSVVHGFSGSAETATRWVRAGHMIGFGGLVTHPRARRVLAAAREIPDTHLLIETDAPDQTPFARRPSLNEPAFLPDVVAGLATIRDCAVEDIASTSWHNAERIFGPVA